MDLGLRFMDPIIEDDQRELPRMLPERLLEEEDIDINCDWTFYVGWYTYSGILNGDYQKQRKAKNYLDLDADHQSLEARDP